MYYFFSNLVNPLPVLVCLIICLVFFFWRKNKKWKIILTIISVGWFLIISTPFISDLLLKNLECSFEPISDAQLPCGSKYYKIMVLGGGHSNDFSLSANDQLSKNALGRLVEGIRLYRKINGSKLILSGWEYNQPFTQAQMLALTAISLGVPGKDMILFNKTENTRQEALEYVKQSMPTDTLLLVTDAVHMPRAMKYFKKAGANPIPITINHVFKNNKNKDYTYYFPSSNNIAKAETVMHEYVGMLISCFQ